MGRDILRQHDSDLRQLGQKWQIVRLELFGSALTSQFRPDSDLDLLVTFADEAQWSLFDMVDLDHDLAALLGRPVDVVTRRAVEQSHNRLRRQAILDTAETIYAAAR